MFDEFFPSLKEGHEFSTTRFLNNASRVPDLFKSGFTSVDVKESDTKFEVIVDVPGFSKKEITLTVDEGLLIIEAKKESSKEEKDDGGKFIRKERSFGEIKRSIFLGKEIDEDAIAAKLENGVLTVNVPKAAVEEKELKKIKIN